MLKFTSLATFFLPFVTVAAPQSKPTNKQDVASTIIAMERAALDRSDKGDPEGFLEISDPGVVYIDPFLDKPIYGLKELTAYYHKNFGYEQAGSPKAGGEIINPKVQVSGDIAVLTFNYVSKGQRSGRINRWNATEVYRRIKDSWRIIHTHWSFIKPQMDP